MGLSNRTTLWTISLVGCSLSATSPAGINPTCAESFSDDCAQTVEAAISTGQTADAQRVLESACGANELTACVMLAVHQQSADGIPQDLSSASRLFVRADQGGLGSGSYHAAVTHHRGIGTPTDLILAEHYYERACTRDYEPGCYDLGLLLTQGEVPINGHKAGRAFLASCGLGNAAACINVTSLIEQDLYEAPEPYTVESLKERACQLLPEACGL